MLGNKYKAADPMTNIPVKLDEAFAAAEASSIEQLESQIAAKRLSNIKQWSFGSYGWTSPVNLFITAAWYKWLFPHQDVCKIWANDHSKKKITGGFAIRTNDEQFTVPLVTKTRIYGSFCSPNSGMQGSRAIEKMRGQGRIDRNTPIAQAVSFDMFLFQNILNDINDCSSEEAYYYLQYLLRLGIDKKNAKLIELGKLSKTTFAKQITLHDILSFSENISDPQFIKVLAVAFLEPLISKMGGGYKTQGISGSKTAADTQSKAPGDFWFIDEKGNPIIAVEVKDKTKNIGFEIIGAIENRKSNNPSLSQYFAVTGAKIAVKESVINDKCWVENLTRIRDDLGLNIITLNLVDLCSLLTLAQVNAASVVKRINEVISQMDDLKKDTIEKWLAFMQ